MKNKLLTTVTFCIISAVILSTLSVTLILHADENTKKCAVSTQGNVTRILIGGMDESADNTDVLMLLSVSHRDGSINLLQIPRDTYVRSEESEGKINRFYHQGSGKGSRKNKAENFLALVSEIFQVKIDAYLLLSMNALSDLVDSMGGVEFHVPISFEYRNQKGEMRYIKEGYQLLNGEGSLAYVRHRSSYAEGDLGRLDAQMRFVAAIFEKIPSLQFPKQYLEIYQKNRSNLLTNLGEKDIINLMMAYLKGKDKLSFHIMRLPGEACKSKEGIWYYVLNRSAASEMLAHYLGADTNGGFDLRQRFTRENDELFMNIYTAPNFSYRVYTFDEAQKAKVLHK